MKKRILDELDQFFGDDKVRSVNRQLSKHEKQLDSISNKAHSLKNDIDVIDARVKTSNTLRGILESKVSGMQDEVNEFRQNVSSILGDFVELEKKALARVIRHAELDGIGEDDHHSK